MHTKPRDFADLIQVYSKVWNSLFQTSTQEMPCCWYSNHLFNCKVLKWRLVNFFCKGPDINIFSFVNHKVPIATTQLCAAFNVAAVWKRTDNTYWIWCSHIVLTLLYNTLSAYKDFHPDQQNNFPVRIHHTTGKNGQTNKQLGIIRGWGRCPKTWLKLHNMVHSLKITELYA